MSDAVGILCAENRRLREEIERLRADRAPLEAIGRVLDEVMSAAVRNGANSVSMPDHYVEIAAWLATHPPAPVVRELTGIEAEQAWAAATRPGGL